MGILIQIINLVYWAFFILIIARIILSFTGMSPYHPFYQTVLRYTEPFLEPVRRFLPPMGGLDFSPMIVILLLGFLRTFLFRVLATGL